jgi:hypothetical protein
VALTGYPTQNLLFAGSLPCLSSRANSSYGTNPTIPATACPLGVVGEVVPHVLLRAQAYGEGLARYRARDFAAAAEQFARIASDDPPAALFLARVRQLAQQPPGPDWEPVSVQEEK